MLDIYFYINTILFIIVGVVMLVGNVTYANYYTRIDKHDIDNFWMIYVIILFCGVINFLITLAAKLLSTGTSLNPVLYASGWVAVLLTIVYLYLISYTIFLGFCNLKDYFGKKRNKI